MSRRTDSTAWPAVLAEFGRQLRSLRKDVKLTQRKLADQMGKSDRTLSDLERGIGERIPDEDLVVAYVDRCLAAWTAAKATRYERRAALLREYQQLDVLRDRLRPGARASSDLRGGPNRDIQASPDILHTSAVVNVITRTPYPGLEAFTADDAEVFFGRDEDVVALFERLQPITRRNVHRFVTVLGPSGSGKSSLVQAGLVPRLLQQRNNWLIVPPLTPENQPVRRLAQSLVAILPDQQMDALVSDLARGPSALNRVCESLRITAGGVSSILVVIDQAEELLTLCSERERHAFLELIRDAVKLDSRLWIVATLRSEFLTGFLQSDFVDLFRDPVVIGTLARSQLSKVIEGPAATVKLRFSPGLVSRLVDDTGGGDALPLLAYVLQALYLRAGTGGVVTDDLYDHLGGVVGALSRQADRVTAELGAIDPNAPVMSTLLKTVTLDEAGTAPVRRRILRSTLTDAEQAVADAFVAARLLTSDADGLEPTIQVAHEALFRQWTPLRQAIATRADDLRQRADIEHWARDWVRSGHRDSYLLQGERLSAAQLWMAAHEDFLTDFPLAASFLERSTKADLVATNRLSEAIALQSLANVNRDPESSLLYALLAVEECAVTPLAQQALLTALSACRAGAVMHGHQDTIGWVAWSPDGTRLASASRDRTIRIWDAGTGAEILVLHGHNGSVDCVAWSPDSARLATTSRDKTVRVWNAATGGQLRVLDGHEGSCSSVAWSPDGGQLVTGSRDRTARIWDALDGVELRVLRGHDNWVEGVAFSPDGARLATGSADGTARIWDSGSGRELRVLRGHEDWVGWVAWSPDGGQLATGSRDRTARIWDALDGVELRVLRSHDNWVEGVAFSPDGARLATGSEDGTARIWVSDTGDELTVLRGHQDWIRGVAWSPNNSFVATASGDRTVRLWDVVGGAGSLVLSSSGPMEAVAWSPDGTGLATSQNRTARIWDAQTGAELCVLRGHTDLVKSVAWAPDGTRVATASRDGTARIWEMGTGITLQVLRGHENWLWDVAWSPDSLQLVTGSSDGTARIWDARTGEELLVLNGHDGAVHGVAWSPDGTRLATGSIDREVKIWDPRNGAEVGVLSGHEQWVECVAWSPNGAQLATVSGDRTVSVWNARSGVRIRIFRGHEEWVESVAWSPDGNRVASASRDQTVRIWDIRKESDGSVIGVHGGWVRSISWSPNGEYLATASSDRTAQMWEANINMQALIAKAHTRHFHELASETRRRLLLFDTSTHRHLEQINRFS